MIKREIDANWKCPICSISLETFLNIYPTRKSVVNHYCHTREILFHYLKRYRYINYQDVEYNWSVMNGLGRFSSLDICDVCNILECRLKIKRDTRSIIPTPFSFAPEEMMEFIFFDGEEHEMDESKALKIYFSISESWLETTVSRSISNVISSIPKLNSLPLEKIASIGAEMKRELLSHSPQMYRNRPNKGK